MKPSYRLEKISGQIVFAVFKCREGRNLTTGFWLFHYFISAFFTTKYSNAKDCDSELVLAAKS